jgi:hypothetical protein
MKKSILLIVSVLLVGTALSAIAQGRRTPTTPSLQHPTETQEALKEALTGDAGEYAARALYKAVIAKLGNVQPFVSILASEEKHIAALQNQWTKNFGNMVPADTHVGVFNGTTLVEAAQEGKKAEELNVAMYTVLLASANLYPSSVVRVFDNLQSASADNHLAAFEAVIAGQTPGTAAVCPRGGQQLAQQGGACLGNGSRQSMSGTCPMGSQWNGQNCSRANCPVQVCPNQNLGGKRQQKSATP